MPDEEDQTGKPNGSPAVPAAPPPAPAVPATPVPPLTPPPGILPPQMMGLQLGVAMQGQQQNPEVMKHITDFLKHDSDNRKESIESNGTRNQSFRMTTLWIGTGLILLTVVVPLLFALFTGDKAFVDEFLTKYIPVLGVIILALLAGPQVSDIFKG